MPRRDDDDEGPISTRLDRRDRISVSHSDVSDLMDRQQKKLEDFFRDREKRTTERAELDAARGKRERALAQRVELIGGQVNDLYSRDKYDTDALKRLERELDEFKVDLLKETRETNEKLDSLHDEHTKLLGRLEGFKWAMVALGGVAGILGPFLAWVFSHIR
jgi:chromosome segregation ATPase